MADDPVIALARKRRGEVRHTREVHTETIPPQVAEALLQMAEKMNDMAMKLIEMENRIAQVEAPLSALAAEAKRRMEAA